MNKETKFLIQSIIQQLVLLIMRDYNVSMLDAFGIIYNSELYERLQDVETGLYYQSPLYVYSYLQDELRKGKIA